MAEYQQLLMSGKGAMRHQFPSMNRYFIPYLEEARMGEDKTCLCLKAAD